MPQQVGEVVRCYHCGDVCGGDHLRAEDHDFCCQGCHAVYGLLQESGLCDYYALSERPGAKVEHEGQAMRAELFDLPEVRDRLVEYRENGIIRVTFHIPQMHCSSCIWLLEHLQRIDAAVLRSRVRFTSKEITVTFREERLSLRGLVELLRRLGYGPSLDGRGKTAPGERASGVPRLLYLRLGIAAFAFGNIMLFSFPEYLGADASDDQLKRGFQFLSLVFALPVVFFSSTDYFRSAWAGLRTRQVNIDQPIALGIIALFARSVWDVVMAIGPGYFDSLAGLLFFLLVGRWYQAYTYGALSFDRGLNDFLPLVVLRRTGDAEQPVAVGDLRPGDRIVVRDQELVPVDAVLLAGEGHIDNSFITGEPLPVRRAVGDVVKAGGRQRGAAIELQVLRAFADSHLKRLWEEHAAGAERPGMPRLIDAVARRFTVAVVLLAVGAGLYWWGRDTSQVWPVVTAVLIVACPCALALSMPFTYGHTIRLLGRRGLFLRDAEVVERIASVDTVVFDKTGTLTEREAHAVRFIGPAPDPAILACVRSLAHNSLHPLSTVLFHHLRGQAGPATGVAEEVGAGIRGEVDGHVVRIGSATFAAGEERPRSHGAAHVHVSVDGAHLGHFEISKRPRTGMAGTVAAAACLTDTYLLTGDLSVDQDIAGVFAPHQVRTGCSPAGKAVFVRGLQAKGRRVMMVGDGLNDAGALRQSDVGITVSETSAALTPASDAILDVRAFGDLPGALRLARSARRIVRASLLLSLGYNITGVSFAVSGQLTPLIAAILMPLSSVTVVGFVSLSVWIRARRLGLSARN